MQKNVWRPDPLGDLAALSQTPVTLAGLRREESKGSDEREREESDGIDGREGKSGGWPDPLNIYPGDGLGEVHHRNFREK